MKLPLFNSVFRFKRFDRRSPLRHSNPMLAQRREILKSRRDDLFIESRPQGTSFLFFSGAGVCAPNNSSPTTRAAEKQKANGRGRLSFYKQVIPTGFQTHDAPSRTWAGAFTLIEIAISLGVIAFALVAIIGVLPMAMNVQKDNRQETIINQDATVLLDAIRHGERGLNDLTNYVERITIYSTRYNGPISSAMTVNTYTYTSTPLGVNTGARIIGLLTTPRYTDLGPGRVFTSNYVVAAVRSMSGLAVEKAPQPLDTTNSLAFTYRLITEISPYSDFSPIWTNYTETKISNTESNARYQYSMVVSNLGPNLHDLRLIFRWPLFANGDVGNKRQVFRTMVSGAMIGPTNENGFPAGTSNLFYFQPRTYVKAK